jgi:hypothetical protein
MKTIPTVLNDKLIRRTIHKDAWWFAVSDIIEALTDSNNWSAVLEEICNQDSELIAWRGRYITPLWLDTPDGRLEIDCTDIEGVFRIVQSITSPKSELLKRWLAKVGSERVREFEDPELATNLTVSLYRAKGYSEAWIAKRMHGIAVRNALTDEWKNRGVRGESEQAILANEIFNAAFDLSPSEYKELKRLDRENPRDHMTDLELVFSMLGEAATTEIARRQDVQGFGENRTAARKGGSIAGEAREKLEQETGEKVVSRENYLTAPEGKKRLTARKISIS